MNKAADEKNQLMCETKKKIMIYLNNNKYTNSAIAE